MIAIDARFNLVEMSGIGRYTLNLIRGLTQIERKYQYCLIIRDETQLPEDLRGLPEFEYMVIDRPPWSVVDQLALRKKLSHKGISLLYVPHAMAPVCGSLKTVVTIHDLIPIICRKQLPGSKMARYSGFFRRWLMLQSSRSSCICTVSQYSKHDLGKHLDIAKDRIEVVRNSAMPIANPDGRVIQKHFDGMGLNKPFLLYTGRIAPYKNLHRLINVFQNHFSENYQLVIAGKADRRWLPDLLKIVSHDKKDTILFTDHIDEDTLAGLYRRARLFVMPSLYEGFGLPVVEAMSVGVPVVLSDLTSLPEVAGDAGAYFNATNEQSMAKFIDRGLHDEDYRGQLQHKGYVRARQFSLLHQAQDFQAVCQRVING